MYSLVLARAASNMSHELQISARGTFQTLHRVAMEQWRMTIQINQKVISEFLRCHSLVLDLCGKTM